MTVKEELDKLRAEIEQKANDFYINTGLFLEIDVKYVSNDKKVWIPKATIRGYVITDDDVDEILKEKEQTKSG